MRFRRNLVRLISAASPPPKYEAFAEPKSLRKFSNSPRENQQNVTATNANAKDKNMQIV